MKRLLLFCLAFQALVFSENRISFPDEYTLTRRILSWTTVFDFESAEGSFATATERLLSLTTTIDFEDAKGTSLATAQNVFFSWGSYLSIVDGAGRDLGFIEEQIWNLLPTYRIYNAAKQMIAVASLNFWGTYFYVTDPANPEKVYATISRPWIYLLREYWTINILDREAFEKKIDHRLLGILAVYQSIYEARLRAFQSLQ